MVALDSAAQALPDGGEPMADLLGDIRDGFANVMGDYPLATVALLVPVGVAFLLYGFRLYRWLVVLAYVGIGVLLGMAAALYLGFSQPVGIMVGAVLLGVLAWPLHRAACGLLGGMLFAVIFIVTPAHAGSLHGRTTKTSCQADPSARLRGQRADACACAS